MTKVVFILVFSLIIAGVLFAALIYPIWTLIHCATSKSRSTKSTTIWIIFMILIWPLVSFLYGLFGSKRKVFQWISGVLIFGLIVVVVVFFYSMNRLTEMSSIEITKTISKIDQIQTGDITQQELIKLKESLSVLKGEIKGFKSLSALDKMHKASSLMQLFDIMAKDNQITHSEYNNWMDKFESRSILNREALQEYIRNLQAK